MEPLRPAEREEPGQLVVVRAAVVENADHVFGNLFQRIYASVGRVQELDPQEGLLLQASVREVEEALQLVLDYVAPLPPAFERFNLGEIVQSLTQRLEATAGLSFSARDELPVATVVFADPGRLGRAFDLMVQRCAFEARGTQGTIAVEIGSESASIQLCLPAAAVGVGSSIDDLRWAVAEKMLEVNGGALEQTSDARGDVSWKITLPRGR